MRRIVRMVLVAACVTGTAHGARGIAQGTSVKSGERAMKHASGSFEVKMTPVEPSTLGKEAGVGRMTGDKVISGDMVGIGKGEMLSGITESTGSMAYVAIEKITATLDGRSGSFFFMHSATMYKGDPSAQNLSVTVVPGSGTGGLAGITGTFAIHIDKAGKHTYVFDYQLP
jgi:hypothetical protein